MANRKYSDRTPDGTSNPLKAEDLIGVSNEDFGSFYQPYLESMAQVQLFRFSLMEVCRIVILSMVNLECMSIS